MKKIYLVALSALTITSAFSQQRTVGTSKPLTNFKATNTSQTLSVPTDTLWGNFLAGTPTIYGSSNGGYVFGVNGYQDFQKSQAFLVSSPFNLEQVLIWFGGLNYTSGNAASKMVVRPVDMNGTGTSVAGAGQPAPGTLIAGATAVDLLVSAVDTTPGNMNVVAFPSPVPISADFAITVDLTTIAAGDTVGIVTTTDGDAAGADNSWEQWSDLTWHSVLEPNNWGLDIDAAIFPIIDDLGTTGIAPMINGVRIVQAMPNPATSATKLVYELDKSYDVKVMMFDVTGKMISTIDQGTQAAGTYTLDLNVSNLAEGTYYVAIRNGSNGIGTKISVTK